MSESDTIDVPGDGEVRARKGTSTAELAGGLSFWHKKYQTAWRDGFFTASVLWSVLGLSTVVIYHYFG